VTGGFAIITAHLCDVLFPHAHGQPHRFQDERCGEGRDVLPAVLPAVLAAVLAAVLVVDNVVVEAGWSGRMHAPGVGQVDATCAERAYQRSE